MNNYKNIDYSISITDTNLIKSFAICAMLWHHLFYTHPEYGTLVFQLGQIGKVCVSLFLFTSAYGLTIQYQRLMSENNEPLKSFKAICKFLLKRFIKFYFNYWAVFFVCVPLGILLGRSLIDAYGEHVNLFQSLILDVLGLQGFSSYNITWWFNLLIILLYLIFPFMYFVLSKNKIITIFTLIILLLWTRYQIVPYMYRYELSTYSFHFALGIVFALNIQQISSLLNKLDVRLVGVIFLSFCIMFAINRNYGVVPFLVDTRMDAFLSPAIALLIVCLNKYIYIYISGTCNVKWCGYLGRHSMNIYMVHTFIYYYFFKDFIYGFKYPIIIFIVLLVLSLLFSISLEFAKNKLGFYKAISYLTSKL